MAAGLVHGEGWGVWLSLCPRHLPGVLPWGPLQCTTTNGVLLVHPLQRATTNGGAAIFNFFGMVAQGYDAIFKIFEMVARWEEPPASAQKCTKTHKIEKLKNGGAGV